MRKDPLIVKSSLLEALYEGMRGFLFPSTNLFSEKIIAVPSYGMRQWIERRIAHDEGLFFGLKLVTIENLMKRLVNPLLPSSYDTTLAIISLLNEIQDPEIDHYLKNATIKRKAELASHLARLVMLYGIHGEPLFEKEAWQKKLWEALHQPPFRFTYWVDVVRYLKRKLPVDSKEVHLFGFSTVPSLYLTLLEKLSDQGLSCSMWLLSPSAYHWSDLFFEKGTKGGSALLCNWGKLAKEMNLFFEESNITPAELYPPLQEGASSLLKEVQNAIIHQLDYTVPTIDETLTIEICASKRIEVEVLFQKLSSFADDNLGWNPQDIIVVCPDLTSYLPYIRAYFCHKDSPFNVTLLDLNKGENNSYFHCFKELIALGKSRFERDLVLHLFTYPCFYKKAGFDQEDLSLIRRFIDEGKIYWGLDEKARSSIYQSYGKGEERGTWKGGFDALLEKLIFLQEDLFIEEPVLLSDAPLLGKLISLIDRLSKHLSAFNEEKSCTLEEWRSLLNRLLEEFFDKDVDEEGYEALRLSFDAILTPFTSLHDKEFAFSTVLERVESVMEEKSGLSGENRLYTIAFGSLKSLRAVPKSWIYLLGMDGSFPRITNSDPLNLLSNCPQPKDEDKLLFLETLLSCRERLTISFSDSDGDGLAAASFVVKELYNSFPCKVTTHLEKIYSFSDQIKPFFVQQEPPIVEVIDIKELLTFAKDPLQTFFKTTLKMRIKKGERIREDSIEPFTLGALDRYQLRKEFGSAKVSLPFGIFKELAVDESNEIALKKVEALTHFGCTEKPFSVHFKKGVVQGEDLLLPPITLEIKDKTVEIVGTLDSLTEKGVLCDEKGDFSDHIKNWPKLLFANHLQAQGIAIVPALLYPRSKTQKSAQISEMAIADFVELFLHSRTSPSLALPEWGKILMELEGEEAVAAIEKEMRSTEFSFPSVYREYLLQNGFQIDSNKLEFWQTFMRRCYGCLK